MTLDYKKMAHLKNAKDACINVTCGGNTFGIFRFVKINAILKCSDGSYV